VPCLHVTKARTVSAHYRWKYVVDSAALTPGKETLILIDYETGWDPGSSWTQLRGEKSAPAAFP